MRKKTTVAGLFMGLLVLLVGLHCYLLDGLDGYFFRAGLGLDTTVYARGYSEAAFRKVSVGLTTAEVLKLLGEPLDKWSVEDLPGVTGMRWTKTPCDGSYAVRVILFERGQVIKKNSEYYVD